MKYSSSTLLFAEYMDQKAQTDLSTSNNLVKTTLEFLIGNEFVAAIQPGQDDVEEIDPLASGMFVHVLYVTLLHLRSKKFFVLHKCDAHSTVK